MSSDIKQKAKDLVSKYPEVFEALMEFERTHKVPKLYRRKRINLTIDENVLAEFKSFCKKNNINMSRYIEKKIIEGVKK